MRKRFVIAPPLLAGLLYFFSHLYPWTRACIVRAYPEVHADASAPMGVSNPVVAGPRRPGARLLWCLGLSLDRLNPTSLSPAATLELGVPSPSTSPPPDDPSAPAAPDRVRH
jgi:hypothetical protein